MQETKYIWRNGKLIPWADATVHVLTHTLHYGSGVFEGIRVYKTKTGSAIFRLEEHIDRLIFSANTINIEVSYTKEELIEAVKELVIANELEEGYIRPFVFSGYGELGIHSSCFNPTEVAIACWPWGVYHSGSSLGLDVKTSSYIRLHPKSTVVEAKICGHYVNSLLAVLEIRGTKYQEVLMLDYEGYVSEGSSVNIFIVKDNIIYTPQLGTILSGITRDFVITLAKDLGFSVIEKQILPQELYDADEAFFVGTAAEVTYIHSLDDKIIGKEGYQPVASKIKKQYHQAIRGELEAYHCYLTNLNNKSVQLELSQLDLIPEEAI
jgi:branched-chain amino acid aminotransferase